MSDNINSSIFFQYNREESRPFCFMFEYLGVKELHDYNCLKIKYPQHAMFDMEKFR